MNKKANKQAYFDPKPVSYDDMCRNLSPTERKRRLNEAKRFVKTITDPDWGLEDVLTLLGLSFHNYENKTDWGGDILSFLGLSILLLKDRFLQFYSCQNIAIHEIEEILKGDKGQDETVKDIKKAIKNYHKKTRQYQMDKNNEHKEWIEADIIE